MGRTVLKSKTEAKSKAKVGEDIHPVDELAMMKNQAEELAEKISELSKRIITDGRLKKGDEVIGREYKVKVGQKINNIFSVEKVFDLLEEDEFLDVVSISATSLKEYLSLQEIDSCVEDTKKSKPYLTVKKLKK